MRKMTGRGEMLRSKHRFLPKIRVLQMVGKGPTMTNARYPDCLYRKNQALYICY
jgi:hypothetical protein